MKAMARCMLAAWLLTPALAAQAEGPTWKGVAAESALRFSAYYEGEELPGRFAEFTVEMDSDADSGAPTGLVVEVKTASADMNDREINAEMDEPEWFDVVAFPLARYESRNIRVAETGFLAVGILRLKGIERELELPFSWQPHGDSAELSGSIRMSRDDWRIGTGEWSNNASLSDRVDLHWRVKLVPAD